MYGKESLENKIPQKGVVSEEGLRHEYTSVLSHEYKGGCILTFL